MADQIKWLRKMTPTEELLQPYGTSYRVTLATCKPLLKDDLNLALRHLFRKVPSLRTCCGDRDGEKWLREMSQEIIDLEIISTGSTEALLAQMQEYPFNMNGPLWCVKLKPTEEKNDEEFPYSYDLFLGVCHAITDGTSNIMICGFLAQLLEDVIAGKSVDDTEQLGVFLSEERTLAVLKEHENLLEADPTLQSSLREEYKAVQSKDSLYKTTYRGVGEEEARSVMLTRDLDVDTTSSFLKRCRAEGVTFNSALAAIANVAMVDLLAEKGLRQDTYGIRSDHAVNVRRFWKGDSRHTLGCHLLPIMTVVTQTPVNAKSTLWSYIKEVNDEFQAKLKSGKLLQEEVVKRSDPLRYRIEYEYTATNMGDVTRVVGEGGENLRVLHILRTALIHKMPCPFALFVHTFRGRLTTTLVYNSTLANPTVAKTYFDQIFHYLRVNC